MNNNATIRNILKNYVRNPNVTAYDILPCGTPVGRFANVRALYRYKNKVDCKRERAREKRRGLKLSK